MTPNIKPTETISENTDNSTDTGTIQDINEKKTNSFPIIRVILLTVMILLIIVILIVNKQRKK